MWVCLIALDSYGSSISFLFFFSRDRSWRWRDTIDGRSSSLQILEKVGLTPEIVGQSVVKETLNALLELIMSSGALGTHHIPRFQEARPWWKDRRTGHPIT